MFARACKTHQNKYDTRAMAIEQHADRHVQYSRRNCLLTHGIEERRQKVTDELVIQTIKSEANIDAKLKHINRTHRIDVKTENKRQTKTVQFTRYSERHKIFNSKKRLKTKIPFPLLKA